MTGEGQPKKKKNAETQKNYLVGNLYSSGIQ